MGWLSTLVFLIGWALALRCAFKFIVGPAASEKASGRKSRVGSLQALGLFPLPFLLIGDLCLPAGETSMLRNILYFVAGISGIVGFYLGGVSGISRYLRFEKGWYPVFAYGIAIVWGGWPLLGYSLLATPFLPSREPDISWPGFVLMFIVGFSILAWFENEYHILRFSFSNAPGPVDELAENHPEAAQEAIHHAPQAEYTYESEKKRKKQQKHIQEDAEDFAEENVSTTESDASVETFTFAYVEDQGHVTQMNAAILRAGMDHQGAKCLVGVCQHTGETRIFSLARVMGSVTQNATGRAWFPQSIFDAFRQSEMIQPGNSSLQNLLGAGGRAK